MVQLQRQSYTGKYESSVKNALMDLLKLILLIKVPDKKITESKKILNSVSGKRFKLLESDPYIIDKDSSRGD